MICRADRVALDSKLVALRKSGLTVEFAANDEPNPNVDALNPSLDGEPKNQSDFPAPQFVVSTKVRGQTLDSQLYDPRDRRGIIAPYC